MMQINSADEIELINRSSSYTVSKSLFCAKIPFFNELWSSQVERQIQFDLSEPCFETLINWVYSDWIVIHGSNFLSMFIVSDHLGIKPITSYCSSFIKANYSAKQIAAFITNKMMDSTIS
uniref:BTB domain-containing protein n=2 Tax=Tetranychus urticae TaxID=32264 RepID=T1JZX9_TETUR